MTSVLARIPREKGGPVTVESFDHAGRTFIRITERSRSVVLTEAEWRALLTPEQYAVMRDHATERTGS